MFLRVGLSDRRFPSELGAFASIAPRASAIDRCVRLEQARPATSYEDASYPYVPDLGDGRYRNPVLFADYSDPDLIRCGTDYYLVSSSFNATPGLPILHSKDLVNWAIVAHALERLPGPRFDRPVHGQGVWAPSIREHAGTFYIAFPIYWRPDDDSECSEEGIWVVSAASPRGPWSAPHQLLAGRGVIDPCLFWDDDGRAYLFHAYAELRAGISDRIDLVPITADATRALGPSQLVFSDPERYPIIEGPKLYKRHGWYYLLAPAGGVVNGFQVALRSRHVQGPYEARIVLERGSSSINGPHQGGMVDTPDGSQWWFLHFQDRGPYGRVVHLNPVAWQDEWPLMGVERDGRREPLLEHQRPAVPAEPLEVPATSDDFSRPSLGLQWQWQANADPSWYELRTSPHALRLFAQAVPGADLAQAANLLLQKVPAPAFRLETRLRLSEGPQRKRAGLVLWGEPVTALLVEDDDSGWCVRLLSADTELASARVAHGTVRLCLAFADGARCTFSYGLVGEALTDFSSVVSMTARYGSWTGVKLGLVSLALEGSGAGAHADFECFEFSSYTAE